MYHLLFLLPAEKYFKKIKDKELKQKFKTALAEIQENPYCGKLKRGDLTGIYGYDIYHNKTNYEIAYRIYGSDAGKKVVVILAGTRENFWEIIKRYMH